VDKRCAHFGGASGAPFFLLSMMPGILPDHCTHERSPLASCLACVEICPRAAWSADDNGLVLDEAACNECGLCMAAGPEGALTAYFSAPLADSSRKAAFWACAPIAGEKGEGVLPCLHAASDQMLADLARRGIRRLQLAQGECASCPRYPRNGLTLEVRLSQINAALQARGLAPVVIERADAATWRKQSDRQQEFANRRGFLGALLKRPGAVLQPPANAGTSCNDATVVGAWLQHYGAGPLPSVPTVDFSRCTLCGACIALCAHQALLLRRSNEEAIFAVSPEHCTGCRLCVDVCADDAVAVGEWLTPPSPLGATLVKQICGRCQNAFWQFAERKERETFCPVCRKTGGKNPGRLVEKDHRY